MMRDDAVPGQSMQHYLKQQNAGSSQMPIKKELITLAISYSCHRLLLKNNDEAVYIWIEITPGTGKVSQVLEHQTPVPHAHK
jgi:hypothetical protein